MIIPWHLRSNGSTSVNIYPAHTLTIPHTVRNISQDTQIYFPKSNSRGGIQFQLKPNRFTKTIFIVDEASMIGDDAQQSKLFEKPKHTFVGHFIGSPGMNILPCEIENGQINFEGKIIPNSTSIKQTNFSKTQIGIRPEFINFSDNGIKVKIKRVNDTGRHKVIDTECSSGSIKILSSFIQFEPI